MTTRRLLLAIALQAVLAVAAAPAPGATLTVDTLVDSASLGACDPATPNDCSLRGAIITANGLAGSTTIEIPAGTYVLSADTNCNGLLTLSLCLSHPSAGRIMILAGAGAGTTIIDANQPAGNFSTPRPVAFVGPTTTAELRGLTVKRGNFSGSFAGGGGVRNFGTLLLVDSVVSDSYTTAPGGGIYTSGPLGLVRSTVARNTAAGDGGGIFVATGGTLSMADSHVVDNSGINGGGVASLYGGAGITGSTISGNIGFSNGGGVFNGAFQTMFLTNTTISGNRGRVTGGLHNSGTAHLQNVTITANTARWFDNPSQGIAGGLQNEPQRVATLANTIIAGNVAASGVAPDCLAPGPQNGALTSGGHNLIQNTDRCDIAGVTTGNILGQSALLGSLANNGGPTPTHAPSSGSPALDAGSPATPGGGDAGACVALDQRGFVRPLGARCDIGALERGGAFAVTSVLPATGGEGGSVSVLVSGAGFASGASVVLRRSGQPDLAAAPAVVDAGGSAISATFDLTGRPAGPWDVVVMNPDASSSILTGGFSIVASRGAELWVDVVGLVRRPGRPSLVTVIYGNRGNVDAAGVPLYLTVPRDFQVGTLFPLAPPPPRGGEVRPDWDQVAPAVATEAASAYIQVPLLLPVVPAGFTGLLRFQLTLPLDAVDSTLLAITGTPLGQATIDPQFVGDTVAAATAYVLRNFNLAVPPALVPDMEQYLTTQLQTIVASGRAAFAGSLGAAGEVYSLAHLSLDLALYALVRSASLPEGATAVATAAPAPAGTWLARASRWLRATARGAVTTLLAWLGPGEAWAAGAGGVRAQNCNGGILGEGQSCGSRQDTWRDVFPPEIPHPPGCDPAQPLQFALNKCRPTPDHCDALPGYRVVTASNGASFCVPERDAKKCSQLIDNPILGGSGNIGCKAFPLKPKNSVDPNEKVGPPGAGTAGWVPAGTPLSYTVHFENLPTATAAAQVVLVTDQLDPARVDLDTFSLGPITFGDRSLVPAPGVQQYTGSVDLRPDQNLIVTVAAGVDTTTGLVTWQFVSIDPDTGQLTEDPDAGFLPPNTSPPDGEGAVLFTVMPKAGIASGTQIANQARVYFDLNAPLDTPVWANALDTAAPISEVLALAASQLTPTFSVQWSGTDADSGLAGYTVFVSRDGGPFEEFVTDTPATSAVFTGQAGSTYTFCSLARDHAGNTESKACPPLAEALTRVAAGAPGHDLAVVKIKAPSGLVVTPGVPVTAPVDVQIQNRGTHAEVLADAGVLGDGRTRGLVRLAVDVVDDDGEGCQPALVSLDTEKNAVLFRKGPRTLKPRAKLTVRYLVTHDCTGAGPRAAGDATPADYRYTATVHHDVLDGVLDAHPEDDACPRPALGVDPNPDGTIKDKGCGARKADRTLGDPILADVYRK